jgi:hypothetical protein
MKAFLWLQVLLVAVVTVRSANAADVIDVVTKITEKTGELLAEQTVHVQIGNKAAVTFEKGKEHFTLEVVAKGADSQSCYTLNIFLERLEPGTQNKKQVRTTVRACEEKSIVFDGREFGAPSIDITVKKSGAKPER